MRHQLVKVAALSVTATAFGVAGAASLGGSAPGVSSAGAGSTDASSAGTPSAAQHSSRAVDRAGTHRAPPAPRVLAQPVSANASYAYRYAPAIQTFARGSRPNGSGVRLTVHAPGDIMFANNDHSLAEIAIRKAGSTGTYIEAGWLRGNGHRNVRLFSFWWNNHGDAQCYNLQCPGFVREGPGLRPGTVLRPHTTVRVGYIHKNHRWILYVNRKRSGYYPDRLWNGTFKRANQVQVFGEVAFQPSGRCIDMGNGHLPTKTSGARAYYYTLAGTRVTPRLMPYSVSNPRWYKSVSVTRASFRYGGPGPC